MKNDSILVIKFEVESQTIANSSSDEFSNKFNYGNYLKLIHLMCKAIYLNKSQIERMIPKQTNDGVEYLCIAIVDCDSIQHGHICQYMRRSIENGRFIKKFTKIYKIKDECQIPIDKITQIRIKDTTNSNQVSNDFEDIASLIMTRVGSVSHKQPSLSATSRDSDGRDSDHDINIDPRVASSGSDSDHDDESSKSSKCNKLTEISTYTCSYTDTYTNNLICCQC